MQIIVFLLLSVSAAMAYAGVVATNMTFSREVSKLFFTFGQPVLTLIDATIYMDRTSDGVSGTCLWKINMFGSSNMDGSGTREPLLTQILDSNRVATPLRPRGRLHFRNVLVNFDISKVACEDIGYLCLEFTQCDSPDPYFSFETSDGGVAIVKCQKEICPEKPKVIIDKFETKPNHIYLVEERQSNVVSFQADAYSSGESDTVTIGFDLWTVSIWGSKEPNGRDRWSFQPQVLSGYYKQIPLYNPGDNIHMSSVLVDFHMTGLKCANVSYICAEFSRDSNSMPSFEMESVTNCFPVSEDNCRGVIAHSLDFDMDFKIIPGALDDVSFDIYVSTLYTSAGAEGDNLWRVDFFTSPSAVGSPKLNHVEQILTNTQSSTDLKPGGALRLDNVNTQVDLTGLGCEKGMEYVCLEFGKEKRAYPDFEFEVSMGGNVLIKCLKQEC